MDTPKSYFNRSACVARSNLYQNIRNFFLQKAYLEVETPSLSPNLIPESTIDNFASTFTNDFLCSREFYLIPSPEIFMKKLIAEGSGNLFQFSKCFRNCEQIGNIHNPEFTMLEYYTMDFDEQDSLSLTEEMIQKTQIPNCPSCVTEPFLHLTVNEACHKYASGLDLDKVQNVEAIRKAALSLGLNVSPQVLSSESWEDTFNRIFLTFVEPSLPKDRPVALDEYPKQIECLAAVSGNYRKRWELYIAGTEVANCYLEETDQEKVRSSFQKEYAKIISGRGQNGKVIPDIDDSFADIFTPSYPKCSGVAIGMDRLLMVEMGEKALEGVILFPFSAML